MFCGNCGAQVPDNSTSCPNCGSSIVPKSQAAQMNQTIQNVGQNLSEAGAKAKEAGKSAFKNLDNKKIGMIAAGAVAVIVVILLLKAIFGGSGLKGTYTNGYTTYTFKGNKMTVSSSGLEMTVKYKIKKDKIVVDYKSLKFSDETLDYLEDYLDMDEDDIKDYIDEYKDEFKEDNSSEYEYDKKTKTLTIDGSRYYYAQNYKAGPSGKFTYEDDDDITITFKNGTATYDNDGDDETLTYYCYKIDDEVYVAFYGEDFQDSDFYKEYYTRVIEIEDDDEIVIDGDVFEK